jgi:phospholipid-binding lipoprotein MlaA
MRITPVAMLSVTVLMVGCASAPSNPIDPLEPMNRSIYAFNDKLDRTVAKPVAKAYRAVTPPPFRTAVNNFFDNILDAYSAANNVLSAQPEKALNDIMRVAINSTLGIFGLVDFATPAGLKSNKNTMGDTLAHWGWKNSNYLVLPFLGPSTFRDGTGTFITLYTSPDRRVIYKTPSNANIAWGMQLLGRRERLLGLEDAVDEAALDPYSYTRDAFMQYRNKQVGGSLPLTQQDDLDIDQLVAPAANDASAPLSVKAEASAAH